MIPTANTVRREVNRGPSRPRLRLVVGQRLASASGSLGETGIPMDPKTWPTTTTRYRWTQTIITLTICLLVLGATVKDQNAPLAWEELLGPDGMGLVGEPKPSSWWLTVMRSPGEPAVFIAAVCVLSLIAARFRDWRLFVVTVIAPPAAVLLTDVMLKPAYGRIHGEGLAFPSGHNTSAAALAVTAGLVVGRLSHHRAAVSRAWLALAVVPICTGFAVIALRYHYPADVVGGWFVGTIVPLALARFTFRSRPVAISSSGP